ncbi:hypothetical protein BDM02DRAFT_1469933 [Thelephora ganbajun]|uniref:Uncharacterized protein n=1 Tax=Thelephora ganbajun TaxID=370292 RepID=A0ACB6Z232_THEGA|nr:hypothetical protein BDM02DRAFT_1469933 [Thelephora ganbajun]
MLPWNSDRKRNEACASYRCWWAVQKPVPGTVEDLSRRSRTGSFPDVSWTSCLGVVAVQTTSKCRRRRILIPLKTHPTPPRFPQSLSHETNYCLCHP